MKLRLKDITDIQISPFKIELTLRTTLCSTDGTFFWKLFDYMVTDPWNNKDWDTYMNIYVIGTGQVVHPMILSIMRTVYMDIFKFRDECATV